jgi:CubicO group peptidase (beta-lactamase class C family)
LYPLITTRFVKVYNEYGEETTTWSFDALASAGALRSTINDIALYAKANMKPGTDKLGNALKLAQKVTFNGEPNIGLGWHIIKVNGVNYTFHNGGTYGSSSFFAFNADKKLAVIILSNATEATDNLGNGLLKKLQ